MALDPRFGDWFLAPAWLPQDPRSAAVIASERLRQRLPKDIEVWDRVATVRLYSENAIVRLEFESQEGLRARFVWKQRYWGGPAIHVWLFYNALVAYRRLFRRTESREEGERLREDAHRALQDPPGGVDPESARRVRVASEYRFRKA